MFVINKLYLTIFTFGQIEFIEKKDQYRLNIYIPNILFKRHIIQLSMLITKDINCI